MEPICLIQLMCCLLETLFSFSAPVSESLSNKMIQNKLGCMTSINIIMER